MGLDPPTFTWLGLQVCTVMPGPGSILAIIKEQSLWWFYLVWIMTFSLAFDPKN
jgi:hypothetical protein